MTLTYDFQCEGCDVERPHTLVGRILTDPRTKKRSAQFSCVKCRLVRVRDLDPDLKFKKVRLASELAQEIRKAKKEGGGFQSFFKELERCLDKDELVVSAEFEMRIHKMQTEYGQGGWQDVLTGIISAIDNAE